MREEGGGGGGRRKGRNKCNSLVGGVVRIDVSYKIEFIDIEVLFNEMCICVSHCLSHRKYLLILNFGH